MKILIAMLILSMIYGVAAVSEGPKNPTLFPATGDVWTNQEDVRFSDGAEAQSTPAINITRTPTHLSSGYGFNLPADARIDGIAVSIKRRQSRANNFYDGGIGLMLDNQPIASTDQVVSGTKILWQSATYEIKTYGGPTNTWNRAWTADEINSPGFGVWVYAKRDTLASGRIAMMDHINITVFYTVCTDADEDGYYGNCGTIDCDDNDDSVYPTALDAECDGIDNNCNGELDDEFITVATSCGIGPCEAVGSTVCISGVVGDTCVAGLAVPEECNNLDDDCNGMIDDSLPITETFCGTGACSATGDLICEDGMWIDTCIENDGQEETCNDIDDDCDEEIDEDFSLGKDCEAGVGACYATGELVCSSDGSTECSAFPGVPSEEVCGNSIDEDCDGLADEDCEVPEFGTLTALIALAGAVTVVVIMRK